mmetsp:Transcript_71665/g.149813  ORF Transcript_71665/g.149813 Transcript_71665/m.149813 type:complete len:106 (-) Transcript_71665:7-324(-)
MLAGGAAADAAGGHAGGAAGGDAADGGDAVWARYVAGEREGKDAGYSRRWLRVPESSDTAVPESVLSAPPAQPPPSERAGWGVLGQSSGATDSPASGTTKASLEA